MFLLSDNIFRQYESPDFSVLHRFLKALFFIRTTQQQFWFFPRLGTLWRISLNNNFDWPPSPNSNSKTTKNHNFYFFPIRMVRRENSTDRHSEILWVHPTQRGAVLDVWKGLDPQHLKKRTKSVGVRSTHGSFSVTILPWGSRIRIRWCHCVTGFLKRDLHWKFGILFLKSGKNG